jgi:hypothetical protein
MYLPQSIDRVLGYFSSRSNWDSPSPENECVPPPFGSGKGHTRWGERGWGDPNSDEGADTVLLEVGIYVLCGVNCWKLEVKMGWDMWLADGISIHWRWKLWICMGTVHRTHCQRHRSYSWLSWVKGRGTYFELWCKLKNACRFNCSAPGYFSSLCLLG